MEQIFFLQKKMISVSTSVGQILSQILEQISILSQILEQISLVDTENKKDNKTENSFQIHFTFFSYQSFLIPTQFFKFTDHVMNQDA